MFVQNFILIYFWNSWYPLTWLCIIRANICCQAYESYVYNVSVPGFVALPLCMIGLIQASFDHIVELSA